MNFFNFLISALSNNRGEIDLGSESEAGEVSDNLADMEALAGLEPETNTEESEADKPLEESVEGDDLRSQLEKFETGEENTPSELLEKLNALGILHKGMPVEFDDIEKVQEILSKGYDYTQKTQELSEMRKNAESEISQERETFEKERETFEAERVEHQEALTQHKILDRVFAEIAQQDPSLIDEIKPYYAKVESQHMQDYDNPLMKKMQARIDELEGKFGQSSKNQEDEKLGEIRQTWENELKQTQSSIGPKLRTLGIKPNWKEVQELWSGDASGKMTVENALFAKYGAEIKKAMDNQTKLSNSKKRTQHLSDSQGSEDEPVFGMESGNSYEKEAMRIWKEDLN